MLHFARVCPVALGPRLQQCTPDAAYRKADEAARQQERRGCDHRRTGADERHDTGHGDRASHGQRGPVDEIDLDIRSFGRAFEIADHVGQVIGDQRTHLRVVDPAKFVAKGIARGGVAGNGDDIGGLERNTRIGMFERVARCRIEFTDKNGRWRRLYAAEYGSTASF